jgi:hypothetical protein
MMGGHRLLAGIGLVALTAAVASAQSHPIFDPDDFIDPAQLGNRPLFIVRLVAGGVADSVDHYRPLRQDVGLVHVANSFYWRRIQFDYKHSEVSGKDNGPIRVRRCDCPDPIYFPTPPPDDATPAAPLPSAKDSLHFGFYVPVGGAGRIPVWLRVRGSWTRQTVDSIVTIGQVESRLSGQEQSFSLDSDTYFRVRGRPVFGTLHFARTVSEGTTDDRTQNEFVYVTRFPGRALGPIIVRATLGVGGVSNRAGTALNVVNPTMEAFWRHGRSRANFHLVWSPVSLNSGAEGWKTTHQVAISVDRALVVTRFRKRE